MFTKRIIPCLDVNGGRVVKGVNFVDLKDAGDPVEIAKAYDKAGADELVFLDITASSDERRTVIDMVRKVAECVFIPFTVGGGIRTVDDFRAILREGRIRSPSIHRPSIHRSWSAMQRTSREPSVWSLPSTPSGARTDPAGTSIKRRAHRRRHRRGGMGHESGAAGRRGDPAHQHGLRRDESGI